MNRFYVYQSIFYPNLVIDPVTSIEIGLKIIKCIIAM